MSDQSFGKSARDAWDDMHRGHKDPQDTVRGQLAVIIHNAWSTEPFDPAHDTEDWIAADAVLKAFPQLRERS